jgi:hypothetical protein
MQPGFKRAGQAGVVGTCWWLYWVLLYVCHVLLISDRLCQCPFGFQGSRGGLTAAVALAGAPRCAGRWCWPRVVNQQTHNATRCSYFEYIHPTLIKLLVCSVFCELRSAWLPSVIGIYASYFWCSMPRIFHQGVSAWRLRRSQCQACACISAGSAGCCPLMGVGLLGF